LRRRPLVPVGAGVVSSLPDTFLGYRKSKREKKEKNRWDFEQLTALELAHWSKKRDREKVRSS
jgi:hypothetical protein